MRWGSDQSLGHTWLFDAVDFSETAMDVSSDPHGQKRLGDVVLADGPKKARLTKACQCWNPLFWQMILGLERVPQILQRLTKVLTRDIAAKSPAQT